MAELRDRLEELERRLERAEKALRNGPPWALRGCSVPHSLLLQTLVTFEDIMVDFNREEWASLDDEQQDLYRTVMEDNYDTLVSLYCALSKPDLVAQMERREEPCVLAKPCWEEADISQEQKLEHSSNDGLLEETNQSVSENREKPEESQSLAVTISCNTLHIPQEAAAVPMDLSQLIQSPSCPRSVCPYEAVNPNQSLSPPPTAADAEVVIPMEVLPEEVAKKPTEPETVLEAMGRVTDMKESGNGQALAASVPEEPGKEVLTDVCHTPAQEAPAVEGSCVGRTAVCQRNSMREKCYSCPICSKNFLLKINLIIHQRSHNSCLPYICAHCKRSFMSKKKIQRHLQARDIKGFCPVLEAEDCTNRAACPASQLLTPNCGTAVWEKPSPNRFPLSPGKMMYTCNECMENFSSQSFLLLHQRRHASRHVILCPCCNRTFTWAKDFVRHHWTHTDERPYQCGVCQKTFKRRYHLNVHQRIHMRQERPYPCSEQQAVPAAPV
ncbi:ZN569 protein, partial [Upupa epops]|nr:ZN569 protein [Upupa epops]